MINRVNPEFDNNPSCAVCGAVMVAKANPLQRMWECHSCGGTTPRTEEQLERSRMNEPRNTPWRLHVDGRISDCTGMTVADCRYGTMHGEAIVQAMNSFARVRELEDALRICESYLTEQYSFGSHKVKVERFVVNAVLNQVRAALRK